jgi:hypothetical protein
VSSRRVPTPVLHLERRGAARSLTAASARQGHFDTAIRQKQALEDDAASTARRMAAANALLGALAGEEGRWTGLSKDFDDQIQRLTGAPPAARRPPSPPAVGRKGLRVGGAHALRAMEPGRARPGCC